MKRLIALITWIGLAVVSPLSVVYASPVADKGVIDLSETSLARSGVVALNGHWHFYWQVFLPPEHLVGHEPMPIRTPSTWGKQTLDIDDQGYGTYHLRVLLSADDVGQVLGLYMPSIASSYDLYLNGVKRLSVGSIGTGVADEEPSSLPQPLYFTTDKQELDLVLHVANHSQRKGGVWAAITLGTAEQIAKERESRTLFDAFIATGLLLMGIYHIGIYYIHRAISTLYFGLACVLLSLRAMFVGEMLANRLLPSLPWELAVKIEYMSVFCGISFLVLYFRHLYDRAFDSRISYLLALFMIVMTLPILVLPARIYTEWLAAYELMLLVLVSYIVLGLVRATFRKYRGAGMNLIVSLLFVATVCNDILHYSFIVTSIDLVALGLFAFTFTQMFMLAQKFSSAFYEVERLRVELEGMNEQLEAIVADRTRALHKTNEKLLEAERAKQNMMSNILHELGNPITLISGYLRKLKDDHANESAKRYVDIMYQKSIQLQRLMGDLRQLVKLEHNRLDIRMKRLPVSELIQSLTFVYEWDLLDRRVRLPILDSDPGGLVVEVDRGRIEQVVTNIVANALAHTKSDDEIIISGRYFPLARAYVISIQDTGVGISREDQKRVFERFYRVEGSGSSGYDGTGLGLSIGKEIVEAHKGRIGVRSRLGRGSTFYLILPIVQGGGV